MPIIIEIKAKCPDAEFIRNVLKENKADFRGIDHQVDTYFDCRKGRLKLREGTIENALIQYFRNNQAGPKKSEVQLYKNVDNVKLKEILTRSLGVLVVVDKKREIYFVNNIKFHIDVVQGLGDFLEIEAIDEDGSIEEDVFRKQCDDFMDAFKVQPEHLVEVSYSDLLLEKEK